MKQKLNSFNKSKVIAKNRKNLFEKDSSNLASVLLSEKLNFAGLTCKAVAQIPLATEPSFGMQIFSGPRIFYARYLFLLSSVDCPPVKTIFKL